MNDGLTVSRLQGKTTPDFGNSFNTNSRYLLTSVKLLPGFSVTVCEPNLQLFIQFTLVLKIQEFLSSEYV